MLFGSLGSKGEQGPRACLWLWVNVSNTTFQSSMINASKRNILRRAIVHYDYGHKPYEIDVKSIQ